MTQRGDLTAFETRSGGSKLDKHDWAVRGRLILETHEPSLGNLVYITAMALVALQETMAIRWSKSLFPVQAACHLGQEGFVQFATPRDRPIHEVTADIYTTDV